MEKNNNQSSTEQLNSYDKYPYYDGSDLELVYSPEQSSFTLWAPTANKVRLNLYSSGENGSPEEQLEMNPAEEGVGE